jgi:eukaryotic-like serine/threonine-protein kinase
LSIHIGYSEPPLRPIIFGELCLLERISIGGMAEVYRAKPLDAPDFDRLLAVKRILPNLAEDDEFVRMFVDEAKIAIRLDHPNIAQIYELGKRGSSHYIVMEYVAGHDVLRLQHTFRQRDGAMAPGQAAYIVRCVAAALYHAHEHKNDAGEPEPVIHRDVSPANVLISFGGEVKLIDFGIAKVANRSSGTQVGVLKGKFSYMSPEQVTGQALDARADLFSLGIVFHELLTGQRLFTSGNDFETLERVRDARVEPPSAFNDAVPWELDNVVMRLLSREREARYSSGRVLMEVLDGYLASSEEPWGREQLSAFMVEAFAEDLERERRRRERYAELVTAEDVQAYNDRLLEEMSGAAVAPSAPARKVESSEETTAVADDEEYQRLLGELDHGELERGKVQEVIAEGPAGRLKRLLERKSDAILASLDLPDPRGHDDAREEVFRPQRRHRRQGVILTAFGALLLCAGVAVWLVSRSWLDGGGEPEAPGMVLLEAQPAEDLHVFLDGSLVGTSTPLVLRDVDAGAHVLEVRHAEYQTYRETVRVAPGRALQLRVVLAERPRGMALVDLRLDPPDAEVWLNGARLGGDSGVRRLQLSAFERHLLEVRREGHYVVERWLELAAEAHEAVAVTLRPVQGRISVRSEPPGRVLLDGEVRGETGGVLVLDELDPMRPYTLRIEPLRPGHQAWETVLVFDGLPELELFATLRRLGERREERPAGVGFLAVETGERWFRVLVDGRDTGQTTPVRVESPLPLRAGVREVTLVRGQEEHTVPVEVAPDVTTLLECRSPGREGCR